MMKRSELLAPAGDLLKAKTALLYGADAVYIGGQSFSLRNRASNFTLEQIQELVDFAHERNKKVYVTVNMIVRDETREDLENYLRRLDQIGIDAIIAASPSIITLAASLNPSYEIHLSTQRTTTNTKTIELYKNLGVSRVVLARENTLEEIADIAENSSTELEVFIHGGMCISYSGRCKLSNYLTGRDANRGGCAQSCRWNYELEENGSDLFFSMGSADLNSLDHIEELMKLGIDSLKIEGRMKSAYYLAVVVSSYRQLIDRIWEGEEISPEYLDQLKEEISKAEKRKSADGFFSGLPDEQAQIYEEEPSKPGQLFVAKVLESSGNELIAQVHNRFEFDQPLEVLEPENGVSPLHLLSLQDMDGNDLLFCNQPMQKVKMITDHPVKEQSMIRKILEKEAL